MRILAGCEIAGCARFGRKRTENARRFPGFAEGEGLSLKLLTELLTLAYELNRSELFPFTKPQNRCCFLARVLGPLRRQVSWRC